ncbi:MAG: hypothetical protein KAI07_11035, partial [Deltaproteobacteria bacterium]|nr:hypothetical protein [Deltaproteobacteria bacterium]
MCGIVGVLSSSKTLYSKDRSNYFEQALFTGAVRGEDSTGVFAVPRKASNEIYLHKKAMASPDYLDSKTGSRILNTMPDYSCVIGHNRSATRGGVSNATAHPFNHGAITLVHNGTLRSAVGHDTQHLDVDSEQIAYALNQVEDPKEVLIKLVGAYVLIWWDTRVSRLFIA